MHAGQVQVEQDEVVELALERLQPLFAGLDGIDDVLLFPQYGDQQVTQNLFVLDDEDACFDFRM